MKEILKMERSKVKVMKGFKMGTYIWECSLMILHMVLGPIYGNQVKATKVNGYKANEKGMEFTQEN